MKNKLIVIMILIVAPLFLGCVEKNIDGKYVFDENSYIILKKDGTFQQTGIKYHMPFATEGIYTVEESNITLHYQYGLFSIFTITDTGIITPTGEIYEKQK